MAYIKTGLPSGPTRQPAEFFINKLKEVHSNKYGYFDEDYLNTPGSIKVSERKIKFQCEHGITTMAYKEHKGGRGCKYCEGRSRISAEPKETIDLAQKGKELFIKNATNLYGNQYEYSEVNYISIRDRVDIVCREHGKFTVTPSTHLATSGCQGCITKKLGIANYDSLVAKAGELYNNKYIYPEQFVMSNVNIKIICPEHGEFYKSQYLHLKGEGCNLCKDRLTNLNYKPKTKMTFDSFVERSMIKHGDKYKYINMEINRNTDLITIICPEHGEFKQRASSHLSGSGCIQCATNAPVDIDTFIVKAQKQHGDRYSYAKFIYKNCKTKGIITCPIHGDFEQNPDSHINAGSGCNRCGSAGTYNEWYFNTFPEMKDIPATLYIVKMHDDYEEFIKIGITKRNHTNRMAQIKHTSEYKVEEILLINTTLYNAWSKEQMLLSQNKEYKYEPLKYFPGHTECLLISNEAGILRGIL